MSIGVHLGESIKKLSFEAKQTKSVHGVIGPVYGFLQRPLVGGYDEAMMRLCKAT